MSLVSPYIENPFSVIDVFSGIGGFSEGALKAGFVHVAGIELDPLCVEQYRRNVSSCWRGDYKAGHPPFRSPFVFADLPVAYGRGAINHVTNSFSSDEVVHTLRIAREAGAEIVGFSWPAGSFSRVAKFTGKMPDTVAWTVEAMKSAGYPYPRIGSINMADYGVPHLRKRYVVFGFNLKRSANLFEFPAPTHGREGLLPDVTVQDVIPGLPYPFPSPSLTRQESHAAWIGSNGGKSTKPSWAGSKIGMYLGRDHYTERSVALTLDEHRLIQGIPLTWKLVGSEKKLKPLVAAAFAPVAAEHLCREVLEVVRSRHNVVARGRRIK